MKPSRWTRSALALCIMGTLTACGSGSDNNAGEGDIADLPEPPPVVVVPPEESGIVNTPLPFLETFGEYTGFDESDTEDFFSANYKSLATAVENSEYEDTFPYFYYPTCCFFLEDDPNMGPDVDLTRLGIVSDAGDPSLLISNARFSIGQTKSEQAGDGADPKKNSTSGSAASGWGEFDLSEPYRISFCVASAEGSGSNTQIYVDNNTTGEANSLHGSSSVIFDLPTDALKAGNRVVVNVPGDIFIEDGAEAVLDVPELVGTEQSFLQFRVSSGGIARIDDLLIEKQTDDGQADLPACSEYEPAEKPAVPEAPSLNATDAQMTVSWTAVLNTATYDVAYGTTDDVNSAMLMEGLESNSATLTELENGTEYFVWVRAENNMGVSDWSASTSATPMAPVGDNCVATQSVDPSPTKMIDWGVYDGCTHPNTVGSVIVNGMDNESFAMDEEEAPFFEVSDLGIMTLNTIDADAKPVGDLNGMITDEGAIYPKYFTFIARIDTSFAYTQGARGFEIETHLGDAGIDGRGPARIKTILRPDSGDNGKIQLERFLSTLEDDGDEETAEVEVDMTDGYHTYQFAFTVNDPATAGTDYITAKVYRDGVEVGSFVGNGREGGSSSSKLRIGEGSGSPFYADVDWIVWSDDQIAAELAPTDLIGELPSGIGELAEYTGEDQGGDDVAFEEDFNGATDGDAGESSFFTTAYRALPDADKPFYYVTGGSSRLVIGNSAEDGNLSINDARFTMGDALADTETDTAAGDAPRGVIDLSKPYTITFDVLVNDNDYDDVTDGEDDTGKCQLYVDNNTSSSSKSVHEGDSKIFEKLAPELADGDVATGTVTIMSEDGEDHVGTANSFLQLRCDSRTTLPVTIDNFKVTYR